MRKMNISVPMIYKDKHGADKTKWVNIGNLVISDDGKVFGDISSTPVGAWDGSFSCFEREDRQQQQNNQQGYQQPQTTYQDNQGQQVSQQSYNQTQQQNQQNRR